MIQTFKNIDVYVKLFPYDYEYLGVYEGKEGLNCFSWSNKSKNIVYSCYENSNYYDRNGDNYFQISEDATKRYGVYSEGNITTVEQARVLIDKFNEDFGLDWKRSQFRLECTSTINL